MNYKQFQTQKLKESIQIDPQDSILAPTLIEKIERIINKPIPQELMDFYSKINKMNFDARINFVTGCFPVN